MYYIYANYSASSINPIPSILLHISDSDDQTLKLINPKIDEQANNAASLTFTILPNHKNYKVITEKPESYMIRVIRKIHSFFYDEFVDDIIFEGRIVEFEKDFYNKIQITCEGTLAYFNDSIQDPIEYVDNDNRGITLEEYVRKLIMYHNHRVDSLYSTANIEYEFTQPSENRITHLITGLDSKKVPFLDDNRDRIHNYTIYTNGHPKTTSITLKGVSHHSSWIDPYWGYSYKNPPTNTLYGADLTSPFRGPAYHVGHNPITNSNEITVTINNKSVNIPKNIQLDNGTMVDMNLRSVHKYVMVAYNGVNRTRDDGIINQDVLEITGNHVHLIRKIGVFDLTNQNISWRLQTASGGKVYISNEGRAGFAVSTNIANAKQDEIYCDLFPEVGGSVYYYVQRCGLYYIHARDFGSYVTIDISIPRVLLKWPNAPANTDPLDINPETGEAYDSDIPPAQISASLPYYSERIALFKTWLSNQKDEYGNSKANLYYSKKNPETIDITNSKLGRQLMELMKEGGEPIITTDQSIPDVEYTIDEDVSKYYWELEAYAHNTYVYKYDITNWNFSEVFGISLLESPSDETRIYLEILTTNTDFCIGIIDPPTSDGDPRSLLPESFFTNFETTWECLNKYVLDEYGGNFLITYENGIRHVNYIKNIIGDGTMDQSFINKDGCIEVEDLSSDGGCGIILVRNNSINFVYDPEINILKGKVAMNVSIDNEFNWSLTPYDKWKENANSSETYDFYLSLYTDNYKKNNEWVLDDNGQIPVEYVNGIEVRKGIFKIGTNFVYFSAWTYRDSDIDLEYEINGYDAYINNNLVGRVDDTTLPYLIHKNHTGFVEYMKYYAHGYNESYDKLEWNDEKKVYYIKLYENKEIVSSLIPYKTNEYDTSVFSNYSYSGFYEAISDQFTIPSNPYSIDTTGSDWQRHYLKAGDVQTSTYRKNSELYYRTSQNITFAKNLTDLNITYNIDDICTVLYPRGAELEQEKGSKLSNYVLLNNSSHRYSPGISSLIAKYGRIEKIVDFPYATTPEQLRSEAIKYMENLLYKNIVVSANAIDIYNPFSSLNEKIGDPFYLLSIVKLYSPIHYEKNDSDEYVFLNKILLTTKITIDISDPSKSTYTFTSDINSNTKNTSNKISSTVANK